MKVVLYQPQIPQNTGNIVRTCAVTGSGLILVKPFGFTITDKHLKRAGLDYWEGVNIEMIEEEDLLHMLLDTKLNFYFYSSKAIKAYHQISYQKEDYLIFGSETQGLPSVYCEKWRDKFLTLPMVKGSRCLNLATSAGIVVYEAWRQQDFFGSARSEDYLTKG